MSEILRITVPFFGLILIGYGAARFGRLREEALAGLNFLVFYLAMPALFFQLIADTPIAEFASWSFVATTTFSTYCAFAFAFSFGALANGGNIPEATIQGLVGSYGDIGYLGPSLTLAAFGTVAAAPMALIFSFDHAMLAVLVPLMMALGGTDRAKFGQLAPQIARAVFLHPFVIATAAGFVASAVGFVPSEPVDGFLTLLGSAAAPGALFVVGANLALRPISRISLDLPFLVAIKLVVHPAIVYLLLAWIGGFDEVWVHVAVLMAALPAAANVFLLAKQYGAYVDRASIGLLAGTIASIATVTIALILLLNDILPANPFN